MTVIAKDWIQPFTSKLLTTSISETDQSRAYLFWLKEGLTSHPTSPWRVVASSNQTTVALGDTWLSESDVNRGTNDTWPGSWIVLKGPEGYPPDIWMILDWTHPTAANLQNVKFTVSAPYLDTITTYRVPETIGSYFGFDSLELYNAGGSVQSINMITMLVASDGSFIVTNPSTKYTNLVDNWTLSGERSLFFFNRLRDVQALDPYGCVCGASGDNSTVLDTPSATTWSGTRIKSLHPSGVEIGCAATWPRSASNIDVPEASADDYVRNWKPFATSMRVISVTSAYEYNKGTLEDMWWGGLYPPKFGQPGFEGQDFNVMQKGALWMPCFEPFRW